MIFKWRGTQDTTWDDGRNWVNEAGTQYAEAVYPGVNNDGVDDVYLDAAPATNALAGYDASAKDIRSFRVGEDYNLAVGSSGTYLQIDADDVIIDAENATAVYLHCNTVTRVLVQEGDAVYFKGTIGTLTALKGTITLDAATTISTKLTVGYTTSETADVTLTIPNITSMCTSVDVTGGTIACSEPITTLNISGGEWTQAAGDITMLNQNGGTCYWNAGNITTANVYAGTLDASQGAGARRFGTGYVYPTAVITLDNGQDNILVTSYIRNFGGTVTTGSGYDLAPYATLTYAGASDAIVGIAPQTINNSNVNSTEAYAGPQDRLRIYCTTGAIAAGGAVTFKVQESATSGGALADVAGKTATFDDGDDNQTKLIDVGGWELTAGKPYVKVNVAESGTQDALVSCVIVKETY